MRRATFQPNGTLSTPYRWLPRKRSQLSCTGTCHLLIGNPRIIQLQYRCPCHAPSSHKTCYNYVCWSRPLDLTSYNPYNPLTQRNIQSKQIYLCVNGLYSLYIEDWEVKGDICYWIKKANSTFYLSTLDIMYTVDNNEQTSFLPLLWTTCNERV